MIDITRLNDSKLVVNADHIKIIEANPDTVITLMNEEKFVVRETIQELVGKVIRFRRCAVSTHEETIKTYLTNFKLEENYREEKGV